MWGLPITEEQFKEVYDFIDHDKDGKITYEDLQQSVGKFISPEECLYFRQDIPPAKLKTCRQENCWNNTKGMGQYCNLHYTIFRNKAEQILLSKLQKQIGKDNFMQFVGLVQQKANTSTQCIDLVTLNGLLAQFNAALSEKDVKAFVEAYGLKSDQPKEQIQVNLEKLT